MIFELRQGSFARGKRMLFEGLSLSVKGGEILAILGQNGVGKTTLLQCLMGFLPLKTGACFIDGKNITSLSQRELFSKLSYVAQAKNHGFSLSVLDMVVLGLNTQIFLEPKKEHYKKASMMIERLNLEHLKNRTCDSLSGGELGMVLFARALVNEPSLIILDEIESHLDFKNQLCILENLKALQAEGRAIIFNTHYPQNAKKLASKVLILEKNTHALAGAELLNKTQLSKSFEVREEFFEHWL
ncbi:ABC transporter [Campylobacter sp. MIT 99-7217]|uniref:ABC transporter ATP-binding protein n=1 Tax=Campylobacter sp. MIT 99-7217 TaxID=535091 RepID=UPI00115C2EB4|nr:ABC transporter ATP-binding protein [Campylobacter sp. MIT 99-7217]TQR33697.1 ABC transporter [Campylobacter sp. MIT 99-7217]